MLHFLVFFFFQAEDGIRDLVRSRGLGDVYKRQYLYVDGARYWYDTRASVTRTAQDLADRLREHPEEVWTQLCQRLSEQRRIRGDFAAVHTCPGDSGAVPDTEEAKLVILHPRYLHSRGSDASTGLRFARQCLDTRASGQRANRNTVV